MPFVTAMCHVMTRRTLAWSLCLTVCTRTCRCPRHTWGRNTARVSWSRQVMKRIPHHSPVVYYSVLYMETYSSLVLGMWALYKLKKSPLLQELSLRDQGNALYRLSENGTLQHFRRVVLVSSPQDMYVPLYSARAEV